MLLISSAAFFGRSACSSVSAWLRASFASRQRLLQRELGLHPGEHDRCRERLVDVVDRADVESLLLVELVGLGREKDNRNVARSRIVL